MSTSSRPVTPLVDASGKITTTWGLRWDKLWQKVFGPNMDNHLRIVDPQLIGTANQLLYSATQGDVEITAATINNTSSGSINVNFFIVAAGAAPGASNQVVSDAVPASSTNQLQQLVGLVIKKGETLWAIAASAGCCVSATGALLTN